MTTTPTASAGHRPPDPDPPWHPPSADLAPRNREGERQRSLTGLHVYKAVCGDG